MLELNENNFDAAISGELPAAVDFWAEWCMPCRIFSPVLEEISDELDDKAMFYKVNIDDYPDLARKYDIEAIPTVVIFKGGEPVDRMVGVLQKDDAKLTVEKYTD